MPYQEEGLGGAVLGAIVAIIILVLLSAKADSVKKTEPNAEEKTSIEATNDRKDAAK